MPSLHLKKNQVAIILGNKGAKVVAGDSLSLENDFIVTCAEAAALILEDPTGAIGMESALMLILASKNKSPEEIDGVMKMFAENLEHDFNYLRGIE